MTINIARFDAGILAVFLLLAVRAYSADAIQFVWKPDASSSYVMTCVCEEKNGDRMSSKTDGRFDVAIVNGKAGAGQGSNSNAVWPVTFQVTGMELKRTEGERTFEIIRRGGDWLWLDGEKVIIDTAAGIGSDALNLIERYVKGGVAASPAGKSLSDETNRVPDTLGLLGQLLPPPLPAEGLAADQPYVVDVRARALGNWSLQEPQAVNFTVTPSVKEVDGIKRLALTLSFRQTLANPEKQRGFKLTSFVDTQTVVGAAVGRGQGEIVIDMEKGEIVSASLNGSYMVTIPGETRNERLQVSFKQTMERKKAASEKKTP